MREQKLQYFEKTESKKQKDFLHNHNHCVLCGTVLELHHIQSDEKQEIEEQAHCPSCNVKNRTKSYPVQ